VVAAATGAAASFVGGRVAEAATGALYYGLVNNADGNITTLKSAFGAGSNFKVETTTGGSNGVINSLDGVVTGTSSGTATATGVKGYVNVTDAFDAFGVYGVALGSSYATGVRGEGTGAFSTGVVGLGSGASAVGVLGSGTKVGVDGTGSDAGVHGYGALGVSGTTTNTGIAVKGVSSKGFALYGTSTSGAALYARSESGTGVHAESDSGNAIYAAAVDPSAVTVDAVHTEGGFALRSRGQTHLVGDAKFSARLYGTGPDAKFEGNGAGLTGLNAGGIATGTLADARLSPKVPLKDAASTVFTGSLTAKSLGGGGAGITNLNAANIATGALADARLTSNIARYNSNTAPFAGKVLAAQFAGSAGGPPAFAGVGTAVVAAGKQTVVVKTPGVDQKGHVLVLFQSNPGAGVWVAHIAKIPGGFRVVLNAKATRAATLAFFVMREA
jgi:hypothetical protein